MKATLFALFVGLLMVGCGSPDLDDPETLDKILAEAIDFDKLQIRGKKGEKLFYAPNKQTPYTGWAKVMYDNGQVKVLIPLKDGKKDGLSTTWYENTQKSSEVNFKDGKPMSAVHWKPNGEECPVTNVKDGNGITVYYNDDGTERIRYTIKDGVTVKD